MLESWHFTYDGVSSKDMGVKIVNLNNGMYNENFLPNRKVIETKIGENPIPFLQRVEEDSFSFSFGILIEDWDKRNQLRSVARWLYKDYYKPLIFESNPDIIIYAMFVNKSELIHNGVKQGYVTLNVQSKSPYMYSHVHNTKISVNGGTTKRLYNNGDKPLYFKIKIDNVLRGDVKITNETENQTFVLTDIFTNESVYIDEKYEYIVSSLEERLNRYLGDHHNDAWITIAPESEAVLRFEGNCTIELEYQYEYLTFDNEIGR